MDSHDEEEAQKLTRADTMYRKKEEVNLNIHEKKSNIEIDNTFRSCCLTMDRRALSFFTTLSISLIIISFCIVQLSGADSCEETNTWLALLMFVIGIWIKSPAM
jgi:hypothetical protein